jgi:hypothetical protein
VAGWSLSLHAGPSTPAKVADAVILTGLPERFVQPKRYLTNHFDAGSAHQCVAIWRTGPAGADGLRLRGTPRLRLTCTTATEQATLIAYLFAVDPVGGGYLITHAPFTATRSRRRSPPPPTSPSRPPSSSFRRAGA